MAFAGIFQPFARLRWIRFGLLMRDCKFSRRFSVPQTTALAPFSSAGWRLLNTESIFSPAPYVTIHLSARSLSTAVALCEG